MVWWVRALGVSLMIHPSMVALVSSKHLPMTILFHQLTGEAREKNPVSNNTRWFRACCTISLFAWFATKLFFFFFFFVPTWSSARVPTPRPGTSKEPTKTKREQ